MNRLSLLATATAIGLASLTTWAAAAAPDGNIGPTQLGAQVSSTATINFGAGATGALKISTGTYEVQFERNVVQCIYSASAFNANVVTTVEPRSGNPNGVFLVVRNSAFAVTDDTFYLSVFCPK